MTSFANLPAPVVAAAASAFATRRREEIAGVLGSSYAGIYDAEALAGLAAASGDGMVAVSRDDFALIAADLLNQDVAAT